MTAPAKAVILAGGSGQRFGGLLPKQYHKLAGRQVIEFTIDEFQAAPDISDVYIICAPEYAEMLWELAHRNGWGKLRGIGQAGADRMGSTWSAVCMLENDPAETKVLFHDAVRPLLGQKIIADCVAALDDFEAVDVAIPSADTLVTVDEHECITAIPRRSIYRRGQTPQGFRLGVIRRAYEKAMAEGRRDFTCDCGVVSQMLPKARIRIVEGSARNIKITDRNDLFMAEKFIQMRTSEHSSSLDESAAGEILRGLKGAGIAIFGGSAGIGKAIAELAEPYGARVHIASRSHGGVDIADRKAVRSFLDRASAEGRIHHVINTAAVLIKKPFSLVSDEDVHQSIGVNLTGLYNVALEARRHLADAPRGCLVNFTSSSYTRGRANYGLYSSAKAAAVNLTQALGEEWVADGIRVVCMNPERTRTEMRTRSFGHEDPKTLLDPAVVARATLVAMLTCPTGLVVDVRQ